jgi:hypothetical protein
MLSLNRLAVLSFIHTVSDGLRVERLLMMGVKQYGLALLDFKDVLEIGYRTDQWLREFVERRARPEPMCGA